MFARKIQLLALGLCLISSYRISPATYPKLVLNYPQEETIQKIKTDLHRTFLINRIKQYSITGIGILAAAFTCYRVAQWSGIMGKNNNGNKNDDIKITDNPQNVEVRVDNLEVDNVKIKTELSAMNKKIDVVKDSIYLPFLSSQWFKQQGNSFAQHFTYVIAAHTVWSKLGTFLTDVFHPGSITWFVQKMPLIKTLQELKQHIMVLDGPSATSGQHKDMYDFFIISSINSLVSNLESIIAFVEYKHSKVKDEKVAIEIAEISRFIFNITKDFCVKVDTTLKDETIDASIRKNKMESYVNEMSSEITRLMFSFDRIEIEKGI